ncbi:MAG TPA: T9SS type A sorting domain-containing protein [Flavobacteriaceae bacterium]|nr:T9SS type A sorting domain-containing protein [Flavobacteriaceae bacterium]
MKAILYILSAIILCFNIPDSLMAQEVENPQEAFAEKEWYLTKIVMEGEEYPFVPTGPVPISSLETQELYESSNGNIFCGIFISHCAMCGDNVLFLSLTEFKTYGGMYNWSCMAYDNCMYSSNPELLAFADLYEMQFWGDDNGSGAHYEINITEGEEEELALVITKEDGNQAYYSDVPLSIPSLEKNEITFYPNPVEDILYIENLSEPAEIEIYNLSGKVLLSQLVNEATKQVNLSRLAEGVYFYQIHQNEKAVKTGKLVKK